MPRTGVHRMRLARYAPATAAAQPTKRLAQGIRTSAFWPRPERLQILSVLPSWHASVAIASGKIESRATKTPALANTARMPKNHAQCAADGRGLVDSSLLTALEGIARRAAERVGFR